MDPNSEYGPISVTTPQEEVKYGLPAWIYRHLVMWEDEGVDAPLNELQSINAWLMYLGRHGQEKTIETMRARMVLLMKAASRLHAAGPEAEEAEGIYKNRPDKRPASSSDGEVG